jgi:hypothetical protein
MYLPELRHAVRSAANLAVSSSRQLQPNEVLLNVSVGKDCQIQQHFAGIMTLKFEFAQLVGNEFKCHVIT